MAEAEPGLTVEVVDGGVGRGQDILVRAAATCIARILHGSPPEVWRKLLVAGWAVPFLVHQEYAKHVLTGRLLGGSGGLVKQVVFVDPHPHDVAAEISESPTNRVFVVTTRPKSMMGIVCRLHLASVLSRSSSAHAYHPLFE